MKHEATVVYLDHLFRDNGRVELRWHNGGRWTCRWFDTRDSLLDIARRWHRPGNLYTSLNRPKSGTTACLRNEDVQRHTRLLFDFDPVRDTGTASTQWELDQSLDRAKGCMDILRACGWPEPLVAVSGNGCHLQYRTALPNTAETARALDTIYAELHRRLSDDVVSFDRTVRNPGRICTLYGSIKRKGGNDPARPWRQSLAFPVTDWRQVTPSQVAKLAAAWMKNGSVRGRVRTSEPFRGSGRGCYASLDVVAWFARHALYKRPLGGNKHAVFCPWREGHSMESTAKSADTVIFEADGGWPGFHCKHHSCSGRGIREVIAELGDADAHCTREWRKAS